MKKFSFWAAVVAVVMCFAACEGPENPPIDNGTDNGKDTTNNGGGNGGGEIEEVVPVEVDFAKGEHIGYVINWHTDLVRLLFTTDGVLIDNETNEYEGDGQVVQVDICPSSRDKYNFPATGTYKIPALQPVGGSAYDTRELVAGEAVPAMVIGQNFYGISVVDVKDGKSAGQKMSMAGWVKVGGTKEAAEITVNVQVVDPATKEKKVVAYKYSGRMQIRNASKVITADYWFPGETKTGDIEAEYNTLKVHKINDATAEARGLQKFALVFGSNKDPLQTAQIYINTPKDLKSVNGTYNVAHKIAANVADATQGALPVDDRITVMPPFAGVRKADNPDDLDKAYYGVSGTVKIESGKISFDMKSFHGGSIKGVYTGKVDIK